MSRLCSSLLAVALLVPLAGCGSDDPAPEPLTEGAHLVVSFSDGRVDTLDWAATGWSHWDSAGTGRLIIRADLEGPPSADVHSLWSLSAILRGPRFVMLPNSMTRTIGITGSDSVSLVLMGSTGVIMQAGTLRIDQPSSGILRLNLDADRTEGPLPFHVTGTVVAAPATASVRESW